MNEQIKIFLMNLWVYSLLIFVTVVGLLITPLLITYFIGRNRWELARTIRHLIWIYGRVWLLIITPFVDFKREGLTSEQVPENCVFVVNHLSFFDTYFIGALPNSDLTFAVRSWPFKMFWYRIFMRLAQYLEVEDLSWEETLRIGGEILNKGGAVVFFPEGHRSRSGQLQRFYSGAFKLAIASGRPIVPLCICGTDELLPPGRRYLKPATVRLHILPTVDNADYSEIGGHIRLRKEVKGQIARQLELMRADGYSADNGEQ